METRQQVGQLMMMGKPPLTGESDREVLALLGAGNAFKPQVFSLTHLPPPYLHKSPVESTQMHFQMVRADLRKD